MEFVPRLFRESDMFLILSSGKQFLDKLHIALNSFHDDFEDFIELVGGEAFDVLCAGIEVASDVGKNSEVSIDRGGITLRRFQDRSLG